MNKKFAEDENIKTKNDKNDKIDKNENKKIKNN